jgi:beta-lactamase class A
MRMAMALCLCAAGIAGASATPPDSVWVNAVRELERTYGGHLGVMAKDLRTGAVLRYNAEERFPTASAIKFPVMTAYFAEVDAGRTDPEARITLSAAEKKEGSGILSLLSDGTAITALDAVKLMIVLSDNTATNMVIDRLGADHETRLRVVNDYLARQGLKNTRLLNRLYSWGTKKNTGEAIRYGIGVSTPEDMVLLLEGLYRKRIASPGACDRMLEIMQQQFYDDMIPRFLPAADCTTFFVAHKTGGIQETKVDVGLVIADRAEIAMAIFVDKHPDHGEGIDNQAAVLAARVARSIWNHFTGMLGTTERRVAGGHVDWTPVPGGTWGIYRSAAAPFPHPARVEGYTRSDGTQYPLFPHYSDSSIVVFVPEKFAELPGGSNLIVHFHGHLGENLLTLERDSMVQGMTAAGINALLVLPQGPYRARDSFGGKMEDDGGLRRLVEDVLATMKNEKIVASTKVNRLCVSGFSGGFRPAAFAVAKGGMPVTDVFLFDALYANQEFFRDWLLAGKGRIFGAYTEHLKKEYEDFAASVRDRAGDRVHFVPSPVEHMDVPRTFVADWLNRLDGEWKLSR